MKRLLAFLAALMAAAALIGCGAEPTQEPESTRKPKATATPMATAELKPDPTPTPEVHSGINYPKNINASKENWNGKTLSIYGGEAPTDPYSRTYAMTEWFKDNFGVAFEYVSMGTDSTTTLTMLVATNQAPTLISDDDSVMPIYAARGLIQPVDKYINQDDTVFLASAFDAYQWKGERYGMQWAGWATFRSVIYNKQAFNDAGLEDPWTRFKQEGEYSLKQLFNDSQDIRTVNDMGEPTRYGWSFTETDVNYLIALNDGQLYTQTTVDGMEKFTLQQDSLNVQHTLMALDEAVQWNKVDYGYASLQEIVSGKRAMYNQVFERAYRMRVDSSIANCPPLGMVPLPNGEDAHGDFALGVATWFNGLIGKGTANPDIGYFWCWINGDEAVGDAVIGEKNTVGGLVFPADYPSAIDPDLIAERWPEDIRDGYFFLKELRAGKEGYRWVTPVSVWGIPEFGDNFYAFCNEVYRDRGSITQSLTRYKVTMQAALDAMSQVEPIAPQADPAYPTLDFSGGLPACIIPVPALAGVSGTVTVANGALPANLPRAISEE